MKQQQIPSRTRAYLERVAGCTGDQAIRMWLTWVDDKGRIQPRYLVHAGVPGVVKWNTEVRSEPKTRLPTGFCAAPEGLALAELVGRVEPRLRVPRKPPRGASGREIARVPLPYTGVGS